MTPVAIVGIGESRVGRLRGLSALRLTLEAARAAIQDAGVTGSEIGRASCRERVSIDV